MHLLLIFVIAMLVFGPKRLPELGKGLGEAIRGFKKGLNDMESAPTVEKPFARQVGTGVGAGVGEAVRGFKEGLNEGVPTVTVEKPSVSQTGTGDATKSLN